MLQQRIIVSEEAWREATELKRKRAYGDVIATTQWTWDEVHERYQRSWGSKGVDFHEMMLRRAADGGELLGWYLNDELVAYAAIRVTSLCGEDGPLLCTTGDLLIQPSLSDDHRDQISDALVHWGTDRGASVFEFLCDAADQTRMQAAGMRPQKVAMRYEPAVLP